MIPAPAQGVLAIEMKSDRGDLFELIKPLIDPEVVLQSEAERVFLETVEGGCHLPVGAYLENVKEKVQLWAIYGNEAATLTKRMTLIGDRTQGKQLAVKAAYSLMGQLETNNLAKIHEKAMVYLVGAGPYNKSLITVRGKELIESAEVIVYGYLPNNELLEYASKDCKSM